MTDPTANRSDTTLDVCFTWNGEAGRVIATFTVLTDAPTSVEQDEVRARALSLAQCRVGEGSLERDLATLPKAVREEIQRVLGLHFVIPRGVRLGGVMYIEKP